MATTAGLNIDSWAHGIQVAFVEVNKHLVHFPIQEVIIIFMLIIIVGFQVFTRNCANCHGMIGKKYDLLLQKVYEQI